MDSAFDNTTGLSANLLNNRLISTSNQRGMPSQTLVQGYRRYQPFALDWLFTRITSWLATTHIADQLQVSHIPKVWRQLFRQKAFLMHLWCESQKKHVNTNSPGVRWRGVKLVNKVQA